MGEYSIIVDTTIKLVLAALCGGVLGVERGIKKRPAGFRTYMLVCIGSTLVMMINDYACTLYATGDPTRLGAQVISGIGFLGAGTIITTGHNRVKGLTTAAGLWASACIGLAIGIGYYEGAIIATIMIVIVIVAMHSLDKMFSLSTKMVFLLVEFDSIASLNNLKNYTRANNISVLDMETELPTGVKSYKAAVVITLRLPARKMREEVIEDIGSLDGVVFVEEI